MPAGARDAQAASTPETTGALRATGCAAATAQQEIEERLQCMREELEVREQQLKLLLKLEQATQDPPEQQEREPDEFLAASNQTAEGGSYSLGLEDRGQEKHHQEAAQQLLDLASMLEQQRNDARESCRNLQLELNDMRAFQRTADERAELLLRQVQQLERQVEHAKQQQQQQQQRLQQGNQQEQMRQQQQCHDKQQQQLYEDLSRMGKQNKELKQQIILLLQQQQTHHTAESHKQQQQLQEDLLQSKGEATARTVDVYTETRRSAAPTTGTLTALPATAAGIRDP
ncbi:putative uncharacterized protein DDB_G0271606 [Cyclospora cayetanensis]|uniref:Uncharacterized protein n=1 Tax=Cyclospora cayetanensis TaxID=88456 RepID=A0A6P6RVG5_9EIME|nr:putative uncharacterized protein DDB_G0271606 [Cyclospora cayetanensis]